MLDQSIPLQAQDINKRKCYPVEGTNLYRILHDPQHRVKFRANLKIYNPLMAAFYRIGLLPLLGVSRNVMLLTTRGRKSGKLRSTPIGYFRIGGVVHLFSAWGKSTAWYRNMQAHPDEVWILIGMKKMRARVEELTDPAEILDTLGQFIRESPADVRYIFGWDPENDALENADFSDVIERVLILRFAESAASNAGA